MPLIAEGAQQPISDAHRLELLIDAVSDYAIYMLDPDGFITTWNAGAQKIKGYSAVEIIGQHFSRFFTTEDQVSGVPEKILASARTTGRHEAEGWRVRKDGTRFWANGILQRVVDEDGTFVGFAKITRDITERMAAEQALLESEGRFRLLVEGVVDYAIYMLDASGIVVNWNTGAERLKGYTADEVVGQHFSRFYTSEERAKGMPVRVLETAAREGRFEGEGWRVRKDGSRFWASVVVDAIRNEAGELQGFAKITRDITERRAAQEALRESERQFRLLVQGVTDYALYMLDPNGIITSWNAGGERIKGYNASEVLGQHFSRFYTEPDRAAGLPARALYTASQEGRFEAEGWRVRKDGSLFWANVVIDPIRDERGDLVGFAKITRDITERREAQIALQEAQAQRAHAQKMDALGQLTGGVAHDFNNLLTVMSGYVRLIEKKVGADPEITSATNSIKLAVERGAALTRQLLTFSRRQAFNSEIISPAERVEAVRGMLAGSIGPNVKLVSMMEPGIWPVKVDPGELELALVNIALNARDAMPDGGIVTVTAENVTLLPGKSKTGLEGDFVVLRIADTGVGIPPDVLTKVFEPFFTTKPADKGTGLGLSQVYGFAHQSGGTVTIDSQVGQGTTVTLYLPRADPSEKTEAPAGGKVLVVESDPELARSHIAMLGQLGYAAEAVGDASAALKAVGSRDFDLVMSDIVLTAATDGVALARAIREVKPDLPVLLAAGHEDKADWTDEFALIRKPVDLAELSRAAARTIAEARQPSDTNVVRLRNARTAGSHPAGE
ncbi:PAS domain S-box protein [Chelativorans sp.]|uniref:PAS domain S-box protein n=1 Tax=Chelativorans sp. TaxID=2203393 RepID=UPI002810BBAA|nr:PAS domain S-box protein [Chelativorans sp.]